LYKPPRALAASDIKIDVLYLQQYIDILADLHGFFAKSGLRNTTLKFYQFEENEPELAILKMAPTRWLSLYRCIKNLRKIFSSVLLTLQEEIRTSKSLHDKEKHPKLFSNVANYKFIAFTHFSFDILNIVSGLSFEC